MYDPTSKVTQLYDEVAQRGAEDNLFEYHVRLLRVDVNSSGALGFRLTLYIYDLADIEWEYATEENGYRPRRKSRVLTLRRGSDVQHIRKAIAYVDAFTGPKGG